MRKLIDNDYLTMIVRLVVAGTFIYASIYKIIDPGAFAKSIWYYHLIPGDLINILALTVPWLELLCGLGLIFGLLYRGSVMLVNLMTVTFILMISSAIARGISIDCGCFKAAQAASDSAWSSLLFDFGLIILTVFLLLSRSRRWMLSRG